MPEIPDGGDYVWWLIGMAAASMWGVVQALGKLVTFVTDRLGGHNGNGRDADRGERRSGLVDLEREVARLTETVSGVPEGMRLNRERVQSLERRADKLEEGAVEIVRTMATRTDLEKLGERLERAIERSHEALMRRFEGHIEDSDRWRRDNTPPGGEPRR